jgi:5'-3' exonuclease
MSSDKDFLQLVDDTTSVWSPTKKILYDRIRTEEDFGMLCENLIYYRIVDGDKSDNINGVRGYALKTILKKMPFLKDTTVNNIEEFIKKSGFTDQEELLLRNYLLMQLENVDISGRAKSIILNIVNGDPNRLVKYKLHKMFLEDTINQSIRNPDVWLQDTFNRLDMVIQNAPSS